MHEVLLSLHERKTEKTQGERGDLFAKIRLPPEIDRRKPLRSPIGS